jgi:uncharacterized protein
MPMNTSAPTFRVLSATEADRFLARHHVGRIAYSFRGRLDIEPIHYVYAEGAIYMRTAPGSKLAALAHAPWIALEADEVDGPFDWRSVVAHGTVYALTDEGSVIARESYRRAVEYLRTLTPSAFRADDPTPDRTVVLEVQPDELTGREATTKPRATPAPGASRPRHSERPEAPGRDLPDTWGA